MSIFEFRDRLTGDYAQYVKSFIQIRDPGIKKYVDQLADEDFLRVQLVNDNIANIEKRLSKVRRRVFLYQLNQFPHTADKTVE